MGVMVEFDGCLMGGTNSLKRLGRREKWEVCLKLKGFY